MQDISSPPLRLMIVEDDPLSREVMVLLAAESGFHLEVYETGDSALNSLTEGDGCRAEVILADLHMPGLCGEPLAKLLRAACAQKTVLLAMSATFVPWETIPSFDAFILKPFSMEDIWAAVDCSRPHRTNLAPGHPRPEPVLNLTTYTSLAELMPGEQVRELYSMCLTDVNKRVEVLRQASLTRDIDAWTRAAHSIKGSSGMVGASELAHLAAQMEQSGLPAVGNIAPLEEFLAASTRLRRMLDAQN